MPDSEQQPTGFNQAESNTNPVPNESTKTIEDILTQVQQGLEAKGNQNDLPLVFQIDKSIVYKAIPGQEAIIDKLNPERLKSLRTALEDPQALSSRVRIYLDKAKTENKVFEAVNGEVLKDDLGLAPPQPEVENAQAAVEEAAQDAEQAKPAQPVAEKPASQKAVEEQQQQFQNAEDFSGYIQQALKANEYQGNLPLSISFDNELIYKAAPGKRPEVNTVTPEQLELIQLAISDPAGLKGEVKISVNDKPVYHVKDGKVLTDTLKLAPAQQEKVSAEVATQAQAQPTQAQAQAQPEVQPQSQGDLEQRIATLESQIAAMQSQMVQTQQELKLVNQQLAKYQQQQQQSPEIAVDKKVNGWLKGIRSTIGNALETLGQKISGRAEQDLAKMQVFQATLQSYHAQTQQNIDGMYQNVTEFMTGTQQKLDEMRQTTTNFVSTAQNTLGKIGTDTTNTMKTVLDQVKTVHDNGVERHYAAHDAVKNAVITAAGLVTGEKTPTRLTINGKPVTVEERPPFNAKEKWREFSQQVKGNSVLGKDVTALTRLAYQAGHSEGEIRQILMQNPKVKQHGEVGTQTLVDIPLRNLNYTLSNQSSQPQTNQQHLQNNQDSGMML
jgi:hypothetical protein